MCGISGFYDYSANFLAKNDYYNKILDDMSTALKHRGPDDSGVILTNHCGLSHTRLSIIDLTGGSQPMTKEFSGFGYHIVYNGEIYNMEELKAPLLAHGITFSTESDTEVLLQSFLYYGPHFITKVDGIYAMAILDERHQTLTLFRDPFGVKPLFYTMHQSTFLFSSEPKGIFAYPGVEAVIDRQGLCEIFGLGPARTQGCGVYKDLHELLPGTYLNVSENGLHQVRFYRLESHPHTDSYEETLDKTRFLVTDAIKRQMVSDVPICTFLSGGVDSSLVSAVCATELKKKNQTLKTYSFDFKDNDVYFHANSFQPSMDRPYVDSMVDYLHSDHSYLECTNKTQADYLYRSVVAHDLPCMADIDSSLLYFCEQVSKNHKVVLTGECADEVFGGYPWFHKPEFLNSNTFPWTPTLTPRKSLLRRDILDELDLDTYVSDCYHTAISEVDLLPEEDETECNRRRIGYLNIRYFMQTLLNRMDRTSMNCGLEARVPFADKALVDYIFNTPWEMKAKDGIVKNVLRQSARGLLPDDILFRKKSPYPKTYNPYYENLLTTRLRTILDAGDSPLDVLLDRNTLNQFLANPKDYGKPWYGQLMAGPQMIAYLLQIDYFLKNYHVRIE